MSSLTVTDNKKRWIFLIILIIAPSFEVYLFGASLTARLLAIVWIGTIFPIFISILLLTTHDTIRLKNVSNPPLEQKITIIVKIFMLMLTLLCIVYFTFPILRGVYELYVLKVPPTEIESSVIKESSVIFAPGLYYGLTLSQYSQTSYTYLFPKIFRFGDTKYKFLILPGTNIVLNVLPEN